MPSKDGEVKGMVGMMLVLLIPFILTLQTIKQPRPLITDLDANPSPYGYTWSLSLFIVPTLTLAIWHSRRKDTSLQKQTFWTTAALLAGCGIMLDVLFGLRFFTFANTNATLGLRFWGVAPGGGFQQSLPIEEIGFYSFGIITVLLVYIWGDEFWFGAYNRDDSPRSSTRLRQLFSFHSKSFVAGVLIFLVGWFYKKHGPHPWHEGFPGYFLFLTVVGTIPSIVFFPVAKPYINWRAFSLAFMFIVLVSLFWEATIAVPYRWWGFQNRQMVGLMINGFSGLPVEEPLLWMGVTWATIIMYETIYTFFCIIALGATTPQIPRPAARSC